MPVKCPSCNLLFGTRNELDWHVREEHTRSRLPPKTPPSPPSSPDRPEPDKETVVSTGPRAWIRRLLRPSGTSRRSPDPDEP
jgi:hypothetical protein